MTLVVPNNGEGDALANFLNKTAPENKTLILFTNNITPAETEPVLIVETAGGRAYAAVVYEPSRAALVA